MEKTGLRFRLRQKHYIKHSHMKSKVNGQRKL
jgi:hypothetical protein